MRLPDYQGASIVNLMSSIIVGLGDTRPDYPALRALEPVELRESRHVVLLVIDGLGYHYLEQHHPRSCLRSHLRARLTSVFPSTTASAVTTFVTGTAPQQHGLTGWFTWFRELGVVAASLPFRTRAGGASLSALGVSADSVFDTPALSERIGRRCCIVLPRRIVDSDYTRAYAGSAERYGYGPMGELFRQVRRLLVRAREPTYIYAYWPELDALAHAHGIASGVVAEHLSSLDRAFAGLVDGLAGTDTTLLVTADHGFVDTTPETRIHLDDHPELARTLMMPLCGEPRAAYCYVASGERRAFESYVARELGGCVHLYTSEELLVRGLFGSGEPHPRLRGRIGDYILVMKDAYSMRDAVPGEKAFVHVGVHGGTTGAEMDVPLIVVRP